MTRLRLTLYHFSDTKRKQALHRILRVRQDSQLNRAFGVPPEEAFLSKVPLLSVGELGDCEGNF